jgi:Spy/CpxP family protein refolding chaperone
MLLTIRALALAAVAAMALPAQETVIGTMPEIPARNYTELKAYLSLSDAQLQSLMEVQSRKSAAEQAIWEQIAKKQETINSLLQANSTDVVQIGQLMVDINRLQKQVPSGSEPYRSQALNALTPNQRTKLAPLALALQLQTTAYQASFFSLIDGPEVRILPAYSGVAGPVAQTLAPLTSK